MSMASKKTAKPKPGKKAAAPGIRATVRTKSVSAKRAVAAKTKPANKSGPKKAAKITELIKPAPLPDWKAELASALALAAGVTPEVAKASLLLPSTPLADHCSNLAFTQAKEKKLNPVQLAAGWAAAGKWPSFVERAEAAGPYLNFHFAPHFWATLLASAAYGGHLGHGEPLAQKVLIEFPSVNPNKPWHVGHLRNAILGDSLARLLAASGRTVERMDYIDDLGLQVAQSVWGKSHLPSQPAPAGSLFANKLDHQLGWQYVEVAKQITKPEVDVYVRAILKQVEEGDEPVASEARRLVEACVRAQYETAFSFGIYHDVLIFESDIVRTIFKEGLAKIIASGAAEKETTGKNAGCLVVRLAGQPGFEGMENADKILIRSDGTATYTGKDVAFQLWKFALLADKFFYSPFMKQPNGQTAYMSASARDSSRQTYPMPFARAQEVVNVIGAEQAYPQKVIAAVMRQMGYSAQADACIHLAYEHVVLPAGRFSGRAGTWMAGGEGGPGFTADELLHEMKERAAEKITADYSPQEKKIIADGVAVASIRFWFLRPSAMQKITFDYEKALSFTGDSGPYIQYAYARAGRILEKGRVAGLAPKIPSPEYKFNEKEIALLRLLLRMRTVIKHGADKHQVHPIADFALETAARFNEFYSTTPVLADEVSPADKTARLMMVAAARKLMGESMDILGLPRLEKM